MTDRAAVPQPVGTPGLTQHNGDSDMSRALDEQLKAYEAYGLACEDVYERAMRDLDQFRSRFEGEQHG